MLCAVCCRKKTVGFSYSIEIVLAFCWKRESGNFEDSIDKYVPILYYKARWCYILSPPHFRTPPDGFYIFLFFIYLLIFFPPEHNLGDCQSVMEFTVVDYVSPASSDAAAAYDNKFISNILSVAHKYRDKRRRLYGTKHYPYARGGVQSVVFYFLIIGRKIYSSAVPRVRCIGLRAHQHTPTFINRKGFNFTTCH